MCRVLAFALLAILPIPSLAAQGQAREAWEKQRRKVLAENGQRHLRLGSWARDRGLVAQATAEFLLAVEVAEGENPGAVQVLGIMRSLDERFWTRKRERPGKRLLDLYHDRATRALRDDREARYRLATQAHRRKLDDVALREFAALVRGRDEALELDDRGRIVLDVGAVPDDVSARLLAETVAVDDRRYARDEATRGLPDGAAVHERQSDTLRVRGTLPSERLDDLFVLGEALLPHLEQRFAGRPVQRVKVFVFATRAEYAGYLAAHAMQRYRNAAGFADYGAQQAIVCAEGADEDGLRGLLLHELAHLYDHQIAPAVLPSWYCEALAQSIGGPGAWRFEDGALELPGRMSPAERDRLAAGIDGFSLRRLLAADAGALFEQDVARAHRFYVEAWGLLEFLRTAAGDGVAARFAVWEDMCRGRAVGAAPKQPGGAARTRDAAEARELFDDMFGPQLDELERAFVAWVRGD